MVVGGDDAVGSELSDGDEDGDVVGSELFDGEAEGPLDGEVLGELDGGVLGEAVGDPLGILGVAVGPAEGVAEGNELGAPVLGSSTIKASMLPSAASAAA